MDLAFAPQHTSGCEECAASGTALLGTRFNAVLKERRGQTQAMCAQSSVLFAIINAAFSPSDVQHGIVPPVICHRYV